MKLPKKPLVVFALMSVAGAYGLLAASATWSHCVKLDINEDGPWRFGDLVASPFRSPDPHDLEGKCVAEKQAETDAKEGQTAEREPEDKQEAAAAAIDSKAADISKSLFPGCVEANDALGTSREHLADLEEKARTLLAGDSGTQPNGNDAREAKRLEMELRRELRSERAALQAAHDADHDKYRRCLQLADATCGFMTPESPLSFTYRVFVGACALLLILGIAGVLAVILRMDLDALYERLLALLPGRASSSPGQPPPPGGQQTPPPPPGTDPVASPVAARIGKLLATGLAAGLTLTVLLKADPLRVDPLRSEALRSHPLNGGLTVDEVHGAVSIDDPELTQNEPFRVELDPTTAQEQVGVLRIAPPADEEQMNVRARLQGEDLEIKLVPDSAGFAPIQADLATLNAELRELKGSLSELSKNVSAPRVTISGNVPVELKNPTSDLALGNVGGTALELAVATKAKLLAVEDGELEAERCTLLENMIQARERVPKPKRCTNWNGKRRLFRRCDDAQLDSLRAALMECTTPKRPAASEGPAASSLAAEAASVPVATAASGSS